MSHISCVQTPVNAAGKKSNSVFFLPKLSLSFTSTRPDDFLDFRVKSGALEPRDIAIIQLNRVWFNFRLKRLLYRRDATLASMAPVSNVQCSVCGFGISED